MAFAHIASVAAGSSDTNDVTTGAIDSTGADLLVAWVANEVGTATLTDSKSNTWTALTIVQENPLDGTLYYSKPTSVGGSHTFTVTSTGKSPSVSVSAFSGSAASPVDQQNSASASAAGTTLATGSITPTEAAELVIAAWACRSASGTISINGGFTEGGSVEGDGVNHESVGLAYLIQTAAAAANPTWTSGNSVGVRVAKIASFKISGAGMLLVF